MDNVAVTRREREYFEVFDELRAEGYISHEEWLDLAPEERESTAKMTNKIIQDALLERGYSRGSPNELLKYRKRWLQKRGFLGLPKGESVSQGDPIYEVVESIRQKLKREAEEQGMRAEQLAQEKVIEAQSKVEEMTTKWRDVSKTLEELQAEFKGVQKEKEDLVRDLQMAEKRIGILEERLENQKLAHQSMLEKEKGHREALIKTKDNAIAHLSKDIGLMQTDHQKMMEELKISADKERAYLLQQQKEMKKEQQAILGQLDKTRLSEQKHIIQEEGIKKQLAQLKGLYDALSRESKQQTKTLLSSEKNSAVLESTLRNVEEKWITEKKAHHEAKQALVEMRGNFKALLARFNELTKMKSKKGKSKRNAS